MTTLEKRWSELDKKTRVNLLCSLNGDPIWRVVILERNGSTGRIASYEEIGASLRKKKTAKEIEAIENDILNHIKGTKKRAKPVADKYKPSSNRIKRIDAIRAAIAGLSPMEIQLKIGDRNMNNLKVCLKGPDGLYPSVKEVAALVGTDPSNVYNIEKTLSNLLCTDRRLNATQRRLDELDDFNLNYLKDHQQFIIIARYTGYEWAEIADMLGKTLTQVRFEHENAFKSLELAEIKLRTRHKKSAF